MDIDDLMGVLTIVEPRSNVQPPRRQAFTHLDWTAKVLATLPGNREAIVRALDFFEPGVGAAGQLLATAKPAAVRTGRIAKYVPTAAQQVEVDKLPRSDGVAEMLAASAFWAATRVAGIEWTLRDGVSASTVALEFTSDGQAMRWEHNLPAISFADYRDAARRVPDKVRTRNPANDIRILGCAAFPQYVLAFALDLHARNTAPYTCRLLDIVPAIVAVAVQRLKERLMVPRPDEPVFAPNPYTPVITIPGFSAVPGGHAAVLFALARVLSEVTGAALSDLEHLAGVLALDRENAGLHTDFDTQVGQALGRSFGQWLVDAVDHPDAFGAWSASFINAANEW